VCVVGVLNNNNLAVLMTPTNGDRSSKAVGDTHTASARLQLRQSVMIVYLTPAAAAAAAVSTLAGYHQSSRHMDGETDHTRPTPTV